MPDSNRRFLLRSRPEGRITEDTFELTEAAAPRSVTARRSSRSSGSRSIRPTAVDQRRRRPTCRRWRSARSCAPSASAACVASKHTSYEEGQLVPGADRLAGVDRRLRLDAAASRHRGTRGHSPSAYLGVLGMTGLTAWVGSTSIGKPQAGETVVVSAAAGAVGSVAGQIAKIKGARVVGIAGGPEKCALLTDRLGVRRRRRLQGADWQDQLVAATPDGIDVDFENVGGEIMDADLRPAQHPRPRRPVRPDLRLQRCRAPPPGRATSATCWSSGHGPGLHRPRPLRPLGRPSPRWRAGCREGKLKPLETVVEGFEGLPSAINMLFDGANTGKLVLRVAS